MQTCAKRLAEDEGILTEEVLSTPGVTLSAPIEPGKPSAPYLACDCVSDVTPNAWSKGTNEKLAAIALRTCKKVPAIQKDSKVWERF